VSVIQTNPPTLADMVSTVAVLSDVHGMLFALDRVLAEPAVAAADLVVVTGDHSWGPQPAEVLDRLVALGDRGVLIRGNADREVLHKAQGLPGAADGDPVATWGAAQLSPAQLALLDRLPESVTLEVDGFGSVLFCHATPRDDVEVVLVDSRLDRWAEVFADLPADVATVVLGHTHMPFLRLAEGRTVINPGSVGLPYGRAGAHWVVLAEGAVTFGRTILDIEELFAVTVASSTMPGTRDWLEEFVRSPALDRDVMAAFGPRDGR
jgi:putative phosphoesterase